MGDFVVANTELGSIVEDGVDVEGRVAGFARELTEAVDEMLLQIVCQVVLGTEEDNAALRDWWKVSVWC